ncbi:FHA domain-containing protein [Candidatus Woesearchaeota archaeon]|nr:FHA domain-containing protein [Candidatus Woesearchaeota archaeon]MBW3006320.1 FHA domain-containing protein [Candidatus Woesearchaeota archaeon]
MSNPIPSLDSISLEFYRREARHFDADHFVSKHNGVGFLVTHGPLPQDDDPMKTQAVQLPSAYETISGGTLEERAKETYPPGSVVFEIPLEQLKRKSQMNILPVGRGANLPITVAHGKISKFHGYFVYNSAGEFTYVDDSSTNGSEINGQKVPNSRKTPIESGASITLAGSFTFTYYSAEDLHAMLNLF